MELLTQKLSPRKLDSSVFVDRVYYSSIEDNSNISYGEYISKVRFNGHIKVLKSLGLYITTGRGSSKAVHVDEMLSLTIKLTLSSNEDIAKNVMGLVDGKLSIKPKALDTDKFRGLPDGIIKHKEQGYLTYIMYNENSNLFKIGRSKNIS